MKIKITTDIIVKDWKEISVLNPHDLSSREKKFTELEKVIIPSGTVIEFEVVE